MAHHLWGCGDMKRTRSLGNLMALSLDVAWGWGASYQTHTTSMRQMVVSTSLGWETTTSEVANTFTSALSFCSVTVGGFGTWILMVSGRDSGYCWNTCRQNQTGWAGSLEVDFYQPTSKRRVGRLGGGSSTRDAHSVQAKAWTYC